MLILQRWWHAFGLGAREWLTGLAEDASGAILALGFSIDIRARPSLLRLSGEGSREWVRPFADDLLPASDQQASGLALAADGALYSAGFEKGVLPAGSRPGLSDGVLTRHNTDGSRLWQRWVWSPRLEQLAGVATTPAGGVLVAGWTDGAVSGTSAGGMDLLLQSYDRDGLLLWSRQLGGRGHDRPSAMAATADGGLVLVGHSDGPLAGLINGRREDAVVLRFDGSGGLIWARAIDTPGTDHGYGVLVMPGGDVLVTGRMAGLD
jgi:hypothetical protein